MDTQRNISLVNDVLDVVMHALVRPPLVWLYVKGHLERKNMRIKTLMKKYQEDTYKAEKIKDYAAHYLV